MTRGCRIEVAAGESGPVVRKEAETSEGRSFLGREIERLERARHPGVVELLDHGEDHLVLAWAGGETLETWRPSLPRAAALLAACAATVADLHELGIVHGRLQARHVVVGPDGRPRLAGFGGVATSSGEPTPADDVAAVGRLMRHLVGPGVELEPIPDRRWSRRRWSGFGRRSLQTLADHATDDDPARRPTARALAAAIAEALPGGELPTRGLTAAGPATTTVPDAAHLPDTSAPTQSPHEGPHRAMECVDHDAPEPDLVGDPRSGPDASAVGDAISGGDEPPSGDRRPGAPAPTASIPADRAEPSEMAGPTEPPEVVDEGADETSTDGSGAATILGLRVEPAPTGTGDPDTLPRTRPRGRPDHPAPERGHVTRDRHRERRTTLAVVGISALVLAAIGTVAALGPGTGSHRSATGALLDDVAHRQPAGVAADPPTGTPAVGRAEAADDCPEVGGPALDLDGDGCPAPVDVDGITIVAGGTTFRVGEPGDVAGVGDWDCDGRATPALLRPTTGEVFVFDGWAEDDRPLRVSAAYTVAGAESLAEPVASACGPPVLALRNGDHHRLGAEDAVR